MTNLEFNLLYDNGKKLIFVGECFFHLQLSRYFSTTREYEIVKLEEVVNKSQDWFNAHQFITLVAEISFKKLVVDKLRKFNPHYFSIIGSKNHISNNVTIGRGTYIVDFNGILDDCIIGDHVIITSHCVLSHNVIVGDFCHIGPFTQLLFTDLGNGCYVGARTSILGSKKVPIKITNYCNFLINSTVNDSIATPGTYYGKRLMDTQTSLDRKID